MTATVVVLSRSPGEWLAPCLESVAGQADRVVLVDNGSAGAVASRIGAAAGATVLRSETNLGFSAGVNLALGSVATELVALLNDDAVAGPGWLEAGAAVLKDPGVAAVTPKVVMYGWYREVSLDDAGWSAPGDARLLGRQLRSVRSDGEDVLGRLAGAGVHRLEQDGSGAWRWTRPGRPWYVPVAGPASVVTVDGETLGAGPVCRLLNKAGSYLRSNGALGDIGAESPDDGRWDRPAECFFASGTALVTRMATLRSVGGLADPFFAYYEDGDWSWRARLAGMRLVYDPSSRVEHRVSATSGGGEWVQQLALRNRDLCLVRNAPARVAASAVRATLGGGPAGGRRNAVLRLLPWALRSRRRLSRDWVVRPEAVWERWADADTTWDDGPLRPPAA